MDDIPIAVPYPFFNVFIPKSGPSAIRLWTMYIGHSIQKFANPRRVSNRDRVSNNQDPRQVRLIQRIGKRVLKGVILLTSLLSQYQIR